MRNLVNKSQFIEIAIFLVWSYEKQFFVVGEFPSDFQKHPDPYDLFSIFMGFYVSNYRTN